MSKSVVLYNTSLSAILMVTAALDAVNKKLDNGWFSHIDKLEFTQPSKENFWIDFTAMVGEKGDVKVRGRVFPDYGGGAGDRFNDGKIIMHIDGIGGYQMYLGADGQDGHGYPIHEVFSLKEKVLQLFVTLESAIPSLLAGGDIHDIYFFNLHRDEVFVDQAESNIHYLKMLNEQDYDRVLYILGLTDGTGSIRAKCPDDGYMWLKKDTQGNTLPHTFGDLDYILARRRFNPTGVDPTLEITPGFLAMTMEQSNQHLIEIVGLPSDPQEMDKQTIADRLRIFEAGHRSDPLGIGRNRQKREEAFTAEDMSNGEGLKGRAKNTTWYMETGAVVGYGDIYFHDLEYASSVIQSDQMLVIASEFDHLNAMENVPQEHRNMPGIDAVVDCARYAVAHGVSYYIPQDYSMRESRSGSRPPDGVKVTHHKTVFTVLSRESLRKMMHEKVASQR
ncbi:hypothetical protein ISS03_03930 [Patescibacteria group bacterium]|nr:hypothetical protein [Patescibacteria group bacterium]